MLFLEPEGRYTNEWYINGLSTSLPLKVQVEMLRSIDGLENVHILRPAYAVEYDLPRQHNYSHRLNPRRWKTYFLLGRLMGLLVMKKPQGRGL